MFTILLIVACIVCGVLLTDSFVQVPAFHYGVVERFGERTGRIFCEGLRIKLPFIDKVKLISMALIPEAIVVGFTSQDKLSVTCKGSLQYRPDPGVVDEKGRNVYITMSKEIIASGMEDTVKAKLGALGGVETADDLIKNRHAIGDIINCFFRLEQPSHLNHTPNDPETCGLTDCAFQGEIQANQLLNFYNQHWTLVKRLLAKEKKDLTRASIEKRYGIDVEVFALADVAFSEETQKAFEKEKQTAAKQKAFNMKLAMAKKVVKVLEAPAQVALDAADVSLDSGIKKQVISVQGDAGILGGFLKSIGKGGDT